MYCTIMYSGMDGFDWDFANKTKNWVKHKVSIKESERVFFNKPLVIAKDPKRSQIEYRFSALGKTDEDRLLVIFFTVRGNKIRVISARDMNKKERQKYEKHSQKT